MKQALLIFNGLKFPHHVVDHALSKVKEQSARLFAIFLVGRETEEGYIFPSDLDASQNVTDKEDAEQDDLRIIQSQMRRLQNMTSTEGIPCETALMLNPDLEEVLSKTQNAGLIFIDANYKETDLMSVTSFHMDELLDRLPAGVEKISEK